MDLGDKMKEGQRIVAEHILAILEDCKGKGKRFRDIKLEMAKRGWLHVDCSIVQNYNWLINAGKIIKVGHYYGIPIKREDGTGYIEVPGEEPVEVWKVKPK
jgi:hypothetical protein